jgi:hypothetical protein
LWGIYLPIGAGVRRAFLRGFRDGVGECVRDSERMERGLSNPFMARAIQLSIEGVQSGRGGPFGAVIVQDGACGSFGDPAGLRKAWRVRIERLRAVHFVRAVPYVPWRDLLGADFAHLFREHRGGCGKVGI